MQAVILNNTRHTPLSTAEMMKRTPEQPIPLQDAAVLDVAKKTGKTPAQVRAGVDQVALRGGMSACTSHFM